MGYGVIGSPTDSGSVSLGSSPGTPALAVLAPSSSGLGRRPLKAVAPVRIRSGLQVRHDDRVPPGARFGVSERAHLVEYLSGRVEYPVDLRQIPFHLFGGEARLVRGRVLGLVAAPAHAVERPEHRPEWRVELCRDGIEDGDVATPAGRPQRHRRP